jgi:hypothetical protein
VVYCQVLLFLANRAFGLDSFQNCPEGWPLTSDHAEAELRLRYSSVASYFSGTLTFIFEHTAFSTHRLHCGFLR